MRHKVTELLTPSKVFIEDFNKTLDETMSIRNILQPMVDGRSIKGEYANIGYPQGQPTELILYKGKLFRP